ncbi:glycerol-3-phosphate acyltransferase [Bacillus sp. J14TS2]|uniref:glycerol-3-phosphate 1-O-acyltransferase PlsY n=1 Tax=Bacillus sp. J14TS2 TaxID=2807188 RepID=UPI001B2B2C55|nr:glycerol-3-phosphate 1-O-acyltransferase PlsY [Bacillus sp. J14TS2]GIN70343.1 glycerol-3-phosphate acyltransferase [Bacillus sp. J14TS2]
MQYVLILLLAYLIGSIPSGLIVGKVFYGIDIREHGSGNLGATNSFRTLGKKAGSVVILADILKGTVTIFLPMMFGSELHPLIPGIFAVIGHMFPVFAHFRGGKAVATSGGILLGYDPLLFISVVIVFLICLKLSKYVSLSSIIVAIFAIIYSLINMIFTKDYLLSLVVALLAAFVIIRHRTNISRIRNKTEPKIKWL